MSVNKIKSESQSMFRCNNCYSTHDAKKAAMVCCSDVVTVHVCQGCCEEHDTKAEATNCCVFWECDECGEEFDTKAEATKCDCEKGEA